MTYSEAIQNLSESLLVYFDEIYHDAEIVTNDNGEKFPAITTNDEWISLVPTDQKETIYIRRNGEDEVVGFLKYGSCIQSYRMRTNLRIVYFKDHAKNHTELLAKLLQSVLIQGTKLKSISYDKWKLQKDESSGSYNFGASTAYIAIDIYVLWSLQPDICAVDYCVAELQNPLCESR